MEVSIKRRALKDFINKALKENRTGHSGDMSDIPAKDDESDNPIEASPQVAIQLSTERPPVEDDDFIPVSREELALSAGEIAKVVPENQFEYFYRMLHKLLDKILDMNDKSNLEAMGLQEAIQLNEEDADDDEDEDLPEIGDEDYDKKLSIEDDTVRATDEILDYFHRPDVFENLVYEKVTQNIAHYGELHKFPVRFAKFKSEAPVITKELMTKEAVKRALSGLTKEQRMQVITEVYNYIIGFLKDPESVSDEDINIGNASAKIDTILKKSENDPEEFKKLLDAEIEKTSGKNKPLSGLMVMIGAKRLEALIAGQDPSVQYQYDDEDDEVEEQPAEEESEKEEKESAIDTWTRIAKEEGFASAAGARQFAFKPTLKMFLQSEVLLRHTMEIVVSKTTRAFRSEISALNAKGGIDSTTARDLMGTAKIGPDVKGNEKFREFLGAFFYQPFINKVLSAWEEKIQEEILKEMGVEDPKRTITKMINGETKANPKKIESVMSMRDFKQARSIARNWIQNSEGMNNFAIEFINAQTKSKSKGKNVLKKILAQEG
jgi:hypothetical protein